LKTMCAAPQFNCLISSLENGVYLIHFNRPQRKNAFNFDIMKEIMAALQFATSNPDVKAVVFTGKGDYFSSGNDLSNFTNMQGMGLEDGKTLLYEFVDALLVFPKLLIAAVNGPAIGIGCTMLGHFDFVYASEKATFNTPFVDLGQTPEACSSYIFPKRLGALKANQMLILGQKFKASELDGLITEVFPDTQKTLQAALQVAQKLAEGAPTCLTSGKRLVKEREVEILKKVNRSEVEELGERWKSPECMEAIMKFLSSRSSKL